LTFVAVLYRELAALLSMFYVLTVIFPDNRVRQACFKNQMIIYYHISYLCYNKKF